MQCNSEPLHEILFQSIKNQISLHSMSPQIHPTKITKQYQNNSEQKLTKQLAALIRSNPQTDQFPKIQNKEKYSRPYLSNTKYVDTLIKNKFLLRRGQFDIPIKIDQFQLEYHEKKPKSLNFKNSIRNILDRCSQSITKKRYSLMKQRQLFGLQSQQRFSTKCYQFPKIIHENQSQYRKLFQGQRSQSRMLQMKRFMKRLVEVEEVRKKINVNQKKVYRCSKCTKKCNTTTK